MKKLLLLFALLSLAFGCKNEGVQESENKDIRLLLSQIDNNLQDAGLRAYIQDYMDQNGMTDELYTFCELVIRMMTDEYWIDVMGRNPESDLELKKIAWDDLDISEQSAIPHRWELAHVKVGVMSYISKEGFYNPAPGRSTSSYIEEKNCYQVYFGAWYSLYTGTTGPVVCIDIETKEILGYPIRL